MSTQTHTTTYTRRTFALLLAAALLGSAAAPARADREADLQERFKRRLGDVRDAKAAGKIGETRAGTLEAVEAKYLEDQGLRTLVDEENADRRELYKLIAEREQTTEDRVAERNAARKYQQARSGEYLKDADGNWKRKK